jgi:predicted ABC-type ATPase
MAAVDRPVIFVLAGVNGAGKSSVGGASLRDQGQSYFNPDEFARRARIELACSIEEANAQAWEESRRRLEAAILNRRSFSFESTLGGSTIPAMLKNAAISGFEVIVWFIGLSDPDLHIARVRERVADGGHDIPEAKIRERWSSSRRNIIDLMPHLDALRVFDNSRERDPVTLMIPPPKLLLHLEKGSVVSPSASVLQATPEWAKPIIARALQLQRGR